ncbi:MULTISPECIES: TetR/AcrR family transcriptional regulator [unclassified Duganella]|jgi:TetR/AcrR family transcriptional repressor of nem operon|uniref:TetR/AcrR family transcriptional regulator n=1 Tax=unclassified Duganella TaxID=2636909 RepID=UPI000B7CCF58|nr:MULTISPECIES: TetR/AcrR family transcriptional regulator [unclassified Duganella]
MAGIKQFNEDEALDLAMHVFWRQGYGATSMPDLAKATGVQRGSLYHAYGDKQSIFLLAFERYRQHYLEMVRERMRLDDPEAALRAYFAYVINSMSVPVPQLDGSPSSRTRGCLTTKIATDETAMDEPVRKALRGMLEGLGEVLEERLSQPDAKARLALPPKDAARLLVTFTRGNVVMERIYHGREELQATADSMIAVLFKH